MCPIFLLAETSLYNYIKKDWMKEKQAENVK